jgi:hypothetical protein
MPKPRAEPRPSPRNHKISRQSKRPPAGRSGDPGADHSITGSAVPVAGAGARTADRASIEAPTNVIFHRIGGRLSWRPLSFQTKRTMSLIGTSRHFAAPQNLSANDPQRMYWWPQRTSRGSLPSVIVHALPEFIWALLVITKRDLSFIRM